MLWKSLKADNTLVFYFSKYNQVTRDQSSINSMKYLYPSYETIGVGPHKSEWISSKHST